MHPGQYWDHFRISSVPASPEWESKMLSYNCWAVYTHLDKLTVMQVNAPLEFWVIDCLTNSLKYVRTQHCVSERVVRNTEGL